MNPVSVNIGGKTVTVTPTLADQVVSYFSPTKGIERLRARTQLAIAGGYTGARRDRKQTDNWKPTDGDADSVILPDLPALRDRSRDLERNSPLAAGAISTKVTSVVGTGLKPRASIDREILTGLTEEQADAWERAAEREFRLATGSKDFDIERQFNFYQSQDPIFRSVLSAGDVFVNLPRVARPGNPYKLRINLIEADRVCNKDFSADSETLVAGVEKDGNGASIKFHVAKFHPGNIRYNKKREWSELKAFDSLGRPLCLHIFRKRRPGQTRGIPDLATVVEMLKQITTYTDSELHAAVVASFLTVVIKSSNPNPQLVDQAAKASERLNGDGLKLGSGSIIGLWPDEDISVVDPSRPNTAAESFLRAMAEQVGAAIELPYELLLKHFTSSYSAARAALLEAWRYFMNCRAWLADEYCRPVWEAAITEAVAMGRLSAPGFFSDPAIRMAYLGCLWTGDAPGQIDETKAVKAAAERVKEGFSTKAAETAGLTGGDWERDERQRAKEQKIEAPRIAATVKAETPPTPEPMEPDMDKPEEEE